MSLVSRGNGGGKDSSTASQGDSPSQAAQRNADDVIPIEELDGPARRQLESVCPGSPADHAEQHECELGGISLRQERDKASLGDALSRRATPDRGCSSCCSFSVLPGAGEQVPLWLAVHRPQA